MPPVPSNALKVMHVISGDLWAGADMQAFTLLSELQATPGVDVRVAVMNDGDLAQRLLTKGIQTVVLDESRLTGWQIFTGLRQLMLAWRPDIVHTHRTKENVLGALANRTSCNVPCLRTAHGATEHRLHGLRNSGKRLYRKLDSLAGNYLQAGIIAVSRSLACDLEKEFAARKIQVIDNGIDVDRIRATASPTHLRSVAPSAFHVGIVGRLVPVKRIDLLLAAAADLRLSAPHTSFHFHIIGDGPERTRLTDQMRTLQLEDRVTFHGHRSDIASCMADLDALVMCSDHEALPMAALESLAIGTPIVAHAVGGLVDLLENSPRSRLVTEHHAKCYATALAELAESPSPASRTSEIPLRFTAAVNCERTLNFYRKLLSKCDTE